MHHPYEMISLARIKPNPKNARTHSKKQIKQLAAIICVSDYISPVLVDENDVLLAGHGRVEAARLLGISSVPAFIIKGLSDAKKRALMLADNRIAQSAGWNREKLAIELAALPELLIPEGLDLSITGFEPAEIDFLQEDLLGDGRKAEDDIDTDCLDRPPVTRTGDLWKLG